jgi:hypothetical protein
MIRAAEMFGGMAGYLAKQFQAVANGADGATTATSYLGNGHAVNAIEAEDGKDVRRFGRAVEVHAIEQVQCRPNGGDARLIGRRFGGRWRVRGGLWKGSGR